MTLLKENVRMTKERGKIMYQDLTNYLTAQVPMIDLDSMIQHSKTGKCYFIQNHTIYYIKKTNLNDLIGEVLANNMKLRTVCFELFQNQNGDLWMAFPDFKQKNNTYYSPTKISSNLSENTLYLWKDGCRNQKNKEGFLDQIFKMFAIDIYMKQQNRISNVKIEKFDNGDINLAPLDDYSDSYWNQFVGYSNGFYNFSSLSDYHKMLACHPQFLEILKQIQTQSMTEILQNIEQQKGITIPSTMKDFYFRGEEISQKKLQKIMK